MNDCAKVCLVKNQACKKNKCRMWINHKKDLNCALVATNNNPGGMTLEQVAERLDLSIVRIKQIQDIAVQKLQKKSHLKP
jgi:hypothetical protein